MYSNSKSFYDLNPTSKHFHSTISIREAKALLLTSSKYRGLAQRLGGLEGKWPESQDVL
jgi:hypothetical protein